DHHVAQHALRVDDERAAERSAVLEKDAVRLRDRVRRVGQDRVAHALETLVRLEPGLVAVVAVRARPENDGLLRRELVVKLTERLDLRRADEGEVTRIEEQHHPLATVVGERNLHRVLLPTNIGLRCELRRLLANLQHRVFLSSTCRYYRTQPGERPPLATSAPRLHV